MATDIPDPDPRSADMVPPPPIALKLTGSFLAEDVIVDVVESPKGGPLPPVPPEKTATFWLNEVRPYVMRRHLASIALGLKLLEAKRALPHGQWSLFCLGIQQMNCVGGLRRIEQLMHVAGNSALTNPNNCSLLPESTSALIELSRTRAETIAIGIRDKKVTPDMTADDARAFVRDPDSFKAKSESEERPFDREKVGFGLRRAIEREQRKWKQGYWVAFVNELGEVFKEWQARLKDFKTCDELASLSNEERHARIDAQVTAAARRVQAEFEARKAAGKDVAPGWRQRAANERERAAT